MRHITSGVQEEASLFLGEKRRRRKNFFTIEMVISDSYKHIFSNTISYIWSLNKKWVEESMYFLYFFFLQKSKTYKRPKCAMDVRHIFSLLLHPPFYTSFEFTAVRFLFKVWTKTRKSIGKKTQNVRDIPIKYLLILSHWITTESIEEVLMWSILFSILSKNNIRHSKYNKSNGKKLLAIKKVDIR